MDTDQAYEAFRHLSTCVLAEILLPGDWNVVVSVYGPESIARFLDFASHVIKSPKNQKRQQAPDGAVTLSLLDRKIAALGVGQEVRCFSFEEKKEIPHPQSSGRVLAIHVYSFS
jgi:hypothetical protein